ncbi:LysR family transcriptional regulator [Rhizobium sp. Root73]|uniref:LysR family transcriptional regulator n=1 Tax=unclassified Rhizobium TaxID=2613769 RepID=UPI00072BA723|nr:MULTISPECIES: LysR family transcriptional regulator [unclassified Rhizobium]KQY14286.1 LysR family transcriptional regulator [Rhizobium sp. Root1334]KRC06174.1 LysR family transcriptional regulator [Rhizobium sp. Root73]
MDRLTSLAVFGQVVECGGFSAAARRMNMSTSMVANHVQSLEDRLGVRLLNRTTRRVNLTETGKFYYDRSSQILADLDEADQFAGALVSTPRGKLKIYTSTAIAPFLVPLMSEYMQQYSSVVIELDIGERMIDMIEEGYDLVIRTTLRDSRLIARKLTPWRHFVVCSPDYLKSHPAPEQPSDLASHNCLQYSHYAYGTSWHFENSAGVKEEVKIEGNFVSNSPQTLRELAIDGHGVFLAPSFLVFDDLKAGRLISNMPNYRGVEFSIDALFPERRQLPTKVRLFIELLVERFFEHRKWMA